MDALSSITIQRADPDSGDVRPLIAAHLAHSDGSSPETSNHTMDVKGLMDPRIRFWTVSNGTGVAALVLETGSMEVYSAARGLYQALGFGFCEPILGYSADPNSVFMRLPLDARTPGPR